MATKTVAQVKALQTSLNKAGANLKVDGIQGAKTNAAIKQFGNLASIGASTNTSSAKSTSTGTTSSSSSSSKPVATTQASSYKNVGSGQTMSTYKGSGLSSSSSKKASSPFSTIGNFFKDAISSIKNVGKDSIGLKASAYDPSNPIYGGSYQIQPDAATVTPVDQIPTPFEIATDFGGQLVDKTASAVKSVGSAIVDGLSSTTTPNTTTNEPTSSTMSGLLENPSINPDVAGTETTKTTETINPNTGEMTTLSETSPLGSNAMVSGTPNADSANKFNTAMSGLNDSIGAMKNNPWDTYSKNGDVVSVADSKINQALGAYTDVASFMNDYNTNPDVKKNVDNYMQVTGKKINDITAKIQTPTNGVVAPQSVDQFLLNTKGANAAAKAQGDAYNKGIIMTSNYNTDQEKMAYTANEEFKKTQEAIRDSMERNEMRKEASVREKANWMIDKNKAEMEIALADIEQNRLLGKNSLTGLLAKLGALDTTSQAGIALTDLDQKYQAQQSSTRAKYLLANREIQMNMNSDINDLENAMEENIIKINSDLSKSEREVALDVMKLRYDTQKTALDYKIKYEDALSTEKEKAIAKAEKASSDWTNAYLTTTGADMFKSLPAEFRTQWLSNNPINAQGFKTTQQDLAKDYSTWSKNQANEFKMTTSQEYKLQQSGVDVNKYKTDEGYRTYVNSNLSQ